MRRCPQVAPVQLELELPGEPWRLHERISRRTRSIRIEVRPDASVALIYPRWVPRSEALAFLRAREAWVRDKLAELAAQTASQDAALPVAAPRWQGQDEVLLRGVAVPVHIEPARLRRPMVRFDAAKISLFVAPEQRAEAPVLEAALRRALLQQARLDARQHLDLAAQPLGVACAALRVADPRTQWGSCNAAAVISLSWRLVMAPPAVFRYVAVHELCHLVHLDHSPRFWRLVEQQMPDYEQHKDWLREHGARLHRLLPRQRDA